MTANSITACFSPHSNQTGTANPALHRSDGKAVMARPRRPGLHLREWAGAGIRAELEQPGASRVPRAAPHWDAHPGARGASLSPARQRAAPLHTKRERIPRSLARQRCHTAGCTACFRTGTSPGTRGAGSKGEFSHRDRLRPRPRGGWRSSGVTPHASGEGVLSAGAVSLKNGAQGCFVSV